MANSKLSRDDIIRLYKFLLDYETEYKTMAQQFNFNAPQLQSFIKHHSVLLASNSKKEKKKKGKYEAWFFYEQRKNDLKSKDDKVHHLLRHFRNSVAHGLIVKESKAVFIFKDKTEKGKITMEGKMKADIFFDFLSMLTSCRK